MYNVFKVFCFDVFIPGTADVSLKLCSHNRNTEIVELSICVINEKWLITSNFLRCKGVSKNSNTIPSCRKSGYSNKFSLAWYESLFLMGIRRMDQPVSKRTYPQKEIQKAFLARTFIVISSQIFNLHLPSFIYKQSKLRHKRFLLFTSGILCPRHVLFIIHLKLKSVNPRFPLFQIDKFP